MSQHALDASPQHVTADRWVHGFAQFFTKLCDGIDHRLAYGKGTVRAFASRPRTATPRHADDLRSQTTVTFTAPTLLITVIPGEHALAGRYIAMLVTNVKASRRVGAQRFEGTYNFTLPIAGSSAALAHLLRNLGRGHSAETFVTALGYMPGAA